MTSALADRRVESIITAIQESDVRRFHLVTADFEIYISRDDDDTVVPGLDDSASASTEPAVAAPAVTPRAPHAASAPTADQPADAATPAQQSEPAPADEVIVLAPIIGVFYIAPEPGADPFVRPGDVVEATATVGLIEAMKLFTAVEAGVAGTVVEVLVQNGDYVEFEQPLMRIRQTLPGA